MQHEVWDDAVEDDAVVVAAADQSLEVGAGFGRVRGVEFESYGALREEGALGWFGLWFAGSLGGWGRWRQKLF